MHDREGGESLPLTEEMGFHAITGNYKCLQLGGHSISIEPEGKKVKKTKRNSGQFIGHLQE